MDEHPNAPEALQWLYVTAASAAEAESIARALVGERLAACANVLEGMRSYYWWEGGVQEGREAVLVLKTRRSMTEAATRRIVELHSYSCPCVVALDIAGGHPDFLTWIANETK